MSNHPTHRLHSLWPRSSADGKESTQPDFKRFATKLTPTMASIETAVAEHPRVSLTLAAALGVFAGWFIKRK